MKKRLLLLVALSVTVVNGLDAADSVPANSDAICVAKFKGARSAALSFTFDDNLRDQYEVAVPLLRKYGIPGTFFAIPGRTLETTEESVGLKSSAHGSISWERLKELASAGHEIASHSWTHAGLIACDDAKLEEEVEKAYSAIKEKIGITPLTFAAPGNHWDDRVQAVVNKYHPVSRRRQASFGTPVPGNEFTGTKANTAVEAMVWMFHAITNGYSAVSSPDVLEDHLKYVKGLGDKIWVDTFANVSRYTMERDVVQLTRTLAADRATFTLACPLDAAQFNFPLTVIIPVKGVANVDARRTDSGAALPVEVQDERILVEAAPSSGNVLVTWRQSGK